MKRVKILAATSEQSEQYNEIYDALKANFDYAMDGFEKLGRDSRSSEEAAVELMTRLNDAVEMCIQEIANNITE